MTLQLGVSALVYANTVGNLNGTIPAAGIQILADTYASGEVAGSGRVSTLTSTATSPRSIEGKVNVPARRRMLMADNADMATRIPMESPTVTSVPRKLTQSLSAAQVT